MKIRLGVNIDHVATIRNARGGNYPSPIEAAKIVKESGADQVTIHLREDRRHIIDSDAEFIIKNIDIETNLEIAPTIEMVEFAIKNKPDFVCLVPEKREELTTEGGLNLELKEVKESINKIKKNNINVCLFIDPIKKNIFKCKDLGVNYVELHTGKYANLKKNYQLDELKLINNCAELCDEFNINCHAGHGLNFENVSKIAQIRYIRELNIGHSLISYAIFNGLENSIIKMINLLKHIRKI